MEIRTYPPNPGQSFHVIHLPILPSCIRLCAARAEAVTTLTTRDKNQATFRLTLPTIVSRLKPLPNQPTQAVRDTANGEQISWAGRRNRRTIGTKLTHTLHISPEAFNSASIVTVEDAIQRGLCVYVREDSDEYESGWIGSWRLFTMRY